MNIEIFSNEYSSFLNNIIHLFPDNEFLLSLNEESHETQYYRIKNLVDSLNTQVQFNNFVKSKIKTFSHKDNDTQSISLSIFGKKLSLKKIFNNQSEITKTLLWNHLHRLVFLVLEEENKDTTDNIILDRIDVLKNIKNNKYNPRNTIKSLLKTDKKL